MAPAEVEEFGEADFAAHPMLAKGYIGPGVLGSERSSGIRYLLDPSIAEGSAWVTGADEHGKHVIDLVHGRDFTADGTIQAAEIREAARARGKEIEAEARARAEEEARRIIEAGEKQLQAARDQVVAELRNEMGQNSISLAERLLGTELSDTTRRSNTIDEFLSELDHVSTRK